MTEEFPGTIERIESYPGKIRDRDPAIVVVGRTVEEAAEWARKYLGKAHFWIAVDLEYSLEGTRCIQVFYLDTVIGEVTDRAANTAFVSMVMSIPNALDPRYFLARRQIEDIQDAGYKQEDLDF